jgi:predicted kinase
MQENNQTIGSQNYRPFAAKCPNHSMHRVQCNERSNVMAKQLITVLMGAPGAGKSTWVRNNASGFEHIYNTEAVRINRDLDVGRYLYIARLKAISALENGKDVIADGTHTIANHRLVWLRVAERLGIDTQLIVFDTHWQICLDVQKTREYPAPRSVVVNHCRNLKIQVRSAIGREGWGSIETITR